MLKKAIIGLQKLSYTINQEKRQIKSAAIQIDVIKPPIIVASDLVSHAYMLRAKVITVVPKPASKVVATE